MLAIISSVWRWRRLVRELARRDFKARYAGSALGVTWSVLEPLIQFGLYLVVFSVFLGMRFEDNPRVGSFGLYLVSGLVPYLAFQESVHRATGLARAEAGLVRHVNAPLEVLLAGSLVSIFVRFGIAFLLVVAARSTGRSSPGWWWACCCWLREAGASPWPWSRQERSCPISRKWWEPPRP